MENNKNIVLIGMPGCGKSTVGVLLAKSLLRDFCDTDLIIQNKFGCSLTDILKTDGLEGFKEKENTVLANLNLKNCVIATGGSAIYCEKGMENLKKDGVLIYLDLPIEEIEKRITNIKTRGIAMKEGETLHDLYEERKPFYEKYADTVLDCKSLCAEECVEKIVEILG